MNTMDLHEVRFTSPPATLDVVHDLLETVWRESAAVGEADRFCFETALVELAANVLQHADTGAGLDCHLRVEVRGDRLLATLSDDGRAGEIQHMGRAMPRTSAESGRGIPLFRLLVDEFEYGRDGDRNHWRLSRRFTR